VAGAVNFLSQDKYITELREIWERCMNALVQALNAGVFLLNAEKVLGFRCWVLG